MMKPKPYFMENEDWYWYEWQFVETPNLILDIVGKVPFLTPEAPPEVIENFKNFYNGKEPVIKEKPKGVKNEN